ncbi:hypothetical protein JR316_0006828 [Psilocybe cubensis]|uniref:Uncharacterized protein n=2 Tax=Psilocybe cubensis TaxID=181762 RepID=A0ACB8GZ44_PSICU|nr:hypothetical protein JR316_0006828 [Psilocybe cubensis]KAH9480230.1 hypothetical protein JR316_0006828 [Psilocybe cubensis]
MALTQSARLPGPSWDEEVVPALRKRLESESRTLARRMSAISLSSVDEPAPLSYTAFADNSLRSNQPPARSNTLQSSGGQRQQAAYQQPPAPDRTMTTVTSRNNGTANTSVQVPIQQRARTYSSPYASNPNGHPNGTTRPKLNTTKTADGSRSLSPRPVDVKPTRIPKASRPPQVAGASSTSNSPYTNGFSHSTPVTPEIPYQLPPEHRAYGTTQRDLVPSSSTRSTIELPARGKYHQSPGLMQESPPFPTESTMSSGFDQDPPRPSIDSEERPYEHWYRGEVSRNGGVGELRVGRRQEMLDIANYGHLIGNKKATSRVPPVQAVENSVRHRKRAGSIAGITNKERERGSVYLDDEHADEVGRVLDEHPLTDLDGEESDINSITDRNAVAYAYLPEDADTMPSEEWTQTAGAHELRSTTPTPSMIPRSSSRQNQNYPPSRIPGPSSRRSSESRSTVTTPPAQNGLSRSTDINSTSTSSITTPSPSVSTSSPNQRQQTYANHTVPSATQKRGMSPASKTKTSRTAAGKATRARLLSQREREKEEKENRESIAQYPTPGDEGEDMADAIPSWTQPVPKTGNWDEVVLPVVARKKGLDGYYENANGSPQPKKKGDAVEPAPGTFGFDHSKYRPPRDFESIPMDEFGRPAEQPTDGKEPEVAQAEKPIDEKPSPHDETRLPVRQPPPQSPVPFAQYAPTNAQTTRLKVSDPEAQLPPQQQQHQMEDDDKDAGCCKCIIM